jgi:hypothetical protein
MFARTGLVWDLSVGSATALAVVALGWLDIANAATADAADASIRQFGTLLTVLFGAIAALWWNMSATLPDRLAEKDAPALQSQRDANTLNAAAATFTAVGLFCSVFAGTPWKSTGSWLSAVGVLMLLALSGSEIRRAVMISLRQRPQLREIFGAVLIAVGAAALIWHVGM